MDAGESLTYSLVYMSLQLKYRSTVDILMGKKARKNNVQNKSIDSICQCVCTLMTWWMSKHGKITSIIMLQVLSWYHSILCSNSYHVWTFPFVNTAVRVHACTAKRNLFDESWTAFISDAAVTSSNLCRTAICLNIIIFVSIKIQ